MGTVGIIANPASGKDIRRLVAYGTVVDNQEKVNIVRRLLLGMAAAGCRHALFMPDYYGIVPKAIGGIASCHKLEMAVESIDIELTGTQADTYHAAAAMNRSGVDCIVSLGGDGTNRMVAKGCGEVPILPVSTGTNNVFPYMIEGTIVGLAAGVVACGVVSGPPAVGPTKKLIVYKNGMPVDMALIDAVIIKDHFIGSRAVWDMERVKQVIVTRGEAHNIGMSSIAGNLSPVSGQERCGLAVELGSGPIVVKAPIAPGLMESIQVSGYRYVQPDEEIEVCDFPCIIALDGEREVEVAKTDHVLIKLSMEGPKMIHAEMALREAVARGYSCTKPDR